MKHSILILFIALALSNCSKPNELQNDFNCKTQIFYNTEKVTDVNEKFTITVPKTWKTSLYFDTVQSQIQTADTIKSLTDTYILITALNNGKLEVNENFKNKVLANLEESNFENAKFKFLTFKNKPSIWFLAKGEKADRTFHQFQLFVKNSATTYFEFTTEIYGDNNVDERLCESIALINKMKLLK